MCPCAGPTYPVIGGRVLFMRAAPDLHAGITIATRPASGGVDRDLRRTDAGHELRDGLEYPASATRCRPRGRPDRAPLRHRGVALHRTGWAPPHQLPRNLPVPRRTLCRTPRPVSRLDPSLRHRSGETATPRVKNTRPPHRDPPRLRPQSYPARFFAARRYRRWNAGPRIKTSQPCAHRIELSQPPPRRGGSMPTSTPRPVDAACGTGS
jgi:hypothetical protein